MTTTRAISVTRLSDSATVWLGVQNIVMVEARGTGSLVTLLSPDGAHSFIATTDSPSTITTAMNV